MTAMTETETAALGELAHAVSAGTHPAVKVLRQKRQDVLTARAALRDGTSVIVKLWNRPGLVNAVRRGSRTLSPAREWHALRQLQRLGVHAPKPVAYLRLTSQGSRHTDAVVMEDLGPCVRMGERMQELLHAGAEAELARSEEALNAATATMIRAGLLDPDHAVMNFVVPVGAGEPARLDLELARNVRFPWLHEGLYAEMLARLWGTYAFIVWPDTKRLARFEGGLLGRIEIPRRVVARARVRVADMVARHSARADGAQGHVAAACVGADGSR